MAFNKGVPLVYKKKKPLDVVHEEDERSPLLSNSASSLTDKDVEESLIDDSLAKKKSRQRWLSIYIMYLTMFTASLTFSIVVSSIWPYLLEVDYDHATTNFLGWVVASFSIGQLIASPIFGLWADKRHTMEPLIVALSFGIVFNVLYAYCGAFGSGVAGWIMVVSRAMVGFGSGIASVTRSYVAEATTIEERTGAMALIGSAQALGFIIGPVFGLAFVPLGSKGLSIPAIKFKLDMYTGPGFLSTVVFIVNVILIAVFFRESRLVSREEKKEKKERRKRDMIQRKQVQDGSVLYPLPKERVHFDWIGALTSLFVFFIILSAFSVFETLLAPLTMDEFGWTKTQSVLYNNIFFAVLSVLTIATLICIKYLSKKVDERVILMVGMFFLAFTFYVLIPMGDEPPKVLSMSTLTLSSQPNASEVPYISLVDANLTIEEVGCRDPPQEWCSHVPRIYFSQLVVALILVTFGYAASSLSVFSIYSKILGPFPQGIMMGVLTSAGSSARALGPLTISNLYQNYGPSITFSTIVVIISITILILLVLSCRLIPYERYEKNRNKINL